MCPGRGTWTLLGSQVLIVDSDAGFILCSASSSTIQLHCCCQRSSSLLRQHRLGCRFSF